MRIVPDANIIVSALITGKGNPGKIMQLWKARAVEILTSNDILHEIARVTSYPRITKKHPQLGKERKKLLRRLAKQATLIHPKSKLHIIKEDESDNRYLECAMSGDARYIISGDKHLLSLKRYKGIIIATPAQFMSSHIQTQ